MKKILFAIALAAAAVAPAAAETYRLESIIAKTELDKFYFKWNDINRIQTVDGKIETETGPIYYRREFAYDAEGRQISETLLQNKKESAYDEDNWVKNDELRYVYNDLGQLDQRLSYYFDKNGEEVFGSMTKFIYDEAGLLQKENVYFDTDMTFHLSSDEYKYDAERRLIERLTLQPTDNGDLVAYSVVTFSYDDDNLLTEVGEFDIDPTDGQRMPHAFKIYTYDAQGNLTKIDMTGSNKVVPVATFEYEYNEIPRAEILYPEAYEKPELNINYEYDYIKFGIKALNDYEMDNNTNQLFLFDTYNYNYEEIGGSGIAAPTMVKGSIVIPVVAGGMLSLNGVDTMTPVTVYDLQGRPVMRADYRAAGLDINALPAGAYIVRAGSSVAKFTK